MPTQEKRNDNVKLIRFKGEVKMKLPNGVTGFYEKQNEPPLTKGKAFKILCYNIIKSKGGRILEFKEPTATNFYDVKVNVFNEKFHILLNAHYPLLAFASFVENGDIDFMDNPDLKKEFNPYYNVLDRNELNEPIIIKPSSKKFTVENENDLNKAEWKQLAYWKPDRIGEVIFNIWD